MVTRIFDLAFHQLENYPQEDALVAKINGDWVPTSTEEFVKEAKEFATGLLKKGIKKGDKIAMIAENRPEWMIADLGMCMIGVINVPIYPTITPEDYEYIMNNAEVKMCLVADKELFEKVNSVKSKVTTLESIYSFDEIAETESWFNIKEMGAEIEEKKLKEIMDSIHEDDMATLIYTSGTTGRPKGVMLSHKNLVSNALGSRERLPVDEKSRSLSFLPLSHVYERMCNYMYVYSGVSIYYAESIDTIGENLKEVKPEVFTAVPRVLEKVYDKIVAKGAELTGIKKALFFWALGLAQKYEIKGRNGWWYEFQLGLANKIIFSKWRDALGNNAKAVASGAAALQPRLARIFLAAKIPIMEGYGLTETSPVIAVNEQKNDGLRIGTVGRPLDKVEVKIAEDGEILVKGPNVMLGYYQNPEATKEVFTDDGYFRTGDLGEMVEGQFLKITGRKKETFKTSGGKFVAPQAIENKMKESNFIEQIMVIGEGEKHPSAIIQPAFDFLRKWAKRKGIEYTTDEEMAKNPQVIDRIMEEVEKYNHEFAQYEKVKKIILAGSVWSIETGEITPTIKVKRNVVMEKYRNEIEKLYRP